MAFFSLGSGNRRAKMERAQRFEQADCVVIKAFTDLKKARYLKNQFPGISPDAVQRFERRVWDRLIDYLIKLPPLPNDE
jgi:hypothetical protein